MNLKKHILLITILILGAFFRFYNLNWDEGFHLHPDERAIVMYALPLKLPNTIGEFFSPASSLNPHFFAYGNFPLYLLKVMGDIASLFNPANATYGQINLVGRIISALADTGTIFFVFLLGKKLFNKNIGLIASLFYAISVLPMQLSHFYAVDTLLTFLVVFTLYQLLNFYERPSVYKALFVGFLFGLSLATKISALVLLVAIGLALVVDFLLIFLKNPHRAHVWLPHLPAFLKKLLLEGTIIFAITIITFIIAEPYALIDFQTFWLHNMRQRQMTYNIFTFPYTLQYVGKIPYFYELKNIFLWGQGPVFTTLSFWGALYFIFRIVRKHLGWWRSNDFDSSEVNVHLRRVHSATSKAQVAQELILIIFFLSYFAVVGKFAVGWMRYMLPLYPFLSLFAAIFVFQVLIPNTKHLIPKTFFIFSTSQTKSHIRSVIGLLIVLAFIGSILLWPLSFINIYTKPNTRVLASEWINQNIPPGKVLATEHWDDGLPLYGGEKYKILVLPLYDVDTPKKWKLINQKLSQADYIIIASNRLYVPLQKLTNCNKLPPLKCYPLTAQYYKKLFNEELKFNKVAEFSAYPTVPLLNIPINDQNADESFTVYDHPKIMIFKNLRR